MREAERGKRGRGGGKKEEKESRQGGGTERKVDGESQDE